jgi:hypothetical protein
MVALILCTTTAVFTAACADRTLAEDFTDDVERICQSMCEMNLACRDPPAFESMDECYAYCAGFEIMYEDSECGRAWRGMYECLGNTANCEEFLDTNNVHAEEYTCMEETLALSGLKCFASEGED